MYTAFNWTVLFLSVSLICFVSGQQCPNLTDHEIDLSPLQGAWDTLFYSQTEGSLVANIPHFFNISLCGPLLNSACGNSSSVCYSSSLEESSFYNLGTNQSRQVTYGDRRVTFTYTFSLDEKVMKRYGTGNVSITLICGRTLGVPEVIQGNPNSDQILIVWETSVSCKTSSYRHFSKESKCYHVHVYEDDGLRASFIDLTSLIRPNGYLVESDSGMKIRFSVCKPLMLRSQVTAQDDFPLPCNGTMGCVPVVEGKDSIGTVVLGEWSDGEESRLHMHNGLLTVQYFVKNISEVCWRDNTATHTRSLRIHFLCPTENQNLGPHMTYNDSSLCLIIISWYTSFACGKSAIQSSGCSLSTHGGRVFDLNGLSTQDDIIDTSSSSQHYVYSLHICQGGGRYEHCDPRPPDNTHVVQLDGNICHSLGIGSGVLRYVDGSLSLTYSHGETCHSNFARTSLITFLCPADQEEGNISTTGVRFLGEEDCFYQFEWVTNLACGSKSSGVSSCQFEIPEIGVYNFAPLVGTQDDNFVAVSSDDSYSCFMINPCGKLVLTTETVLRSGSEYCNTQTDSARKAPRACSGASVCIIFPVGSAMPVGLFDLGELSSISSADKHVLTVTGQMRNSSNTATIHYVCKPGDLSSAPVFVGVVDQFNYEFHWNTFAACPSGLQAGSDCTVLFHGYLFNLSSIPVLRFNSTDGVYWYEVSVCFPLRPTSTTCNSDSTTKPAVCQVRREDHKPYILGMANSTLVYEDGTLKLTYSNGSNCHHVTKPRRTTLLFICDSNAHMPSIVSVTEDDCTYVVEVLTKLACPPANRATECIYLNNGTTYDFSVLSRSQDQGNWQTRGPDGSEYFINVCQPLNLVSGCSPLAGACRIMSHDGHMTYINLGLAYNTTFYPHGEHVKLVYEYPSSSQRCPKVYTTIMLVCSNRTDSSEMGPHYVSGGDDQDSCDYTFTWETVGACPVKRITRSNICQISTPTNFTFDLTPLATPSDHRGYYQIGPDDSSTFSFNLSLCSPLEDRCNGNPNVSVCQEDSTHKFHICGLSTRRELSYFDGALSLRFRGGDVCKHNKMKREVLVMFECDRSANVTGTLPKYLNESECAYSFSWATPLACLPQELDCVAAGGKYDFTPLLQRRHWTVDSDEYTYVIGGCRSLDYLKLPQCPQVPWMGGCRYKGTGSGSKSGPVGSVLGFVTGDIVEEDEGVLRLEYLNGDTCDGGRKAMVHIHFTCGPGTRQGVPTLDAASNLCHTHINWVTQYACSRITNTSSSNRWVLKDPITSTVINLTSLPPNLTYNYMDKENTDVNGDSVSYDYTVSLHGGPVTCNSADAVTYNGAPGACQVKKTSLAGGCNSKQPRCVHTLGYLGDNSSSLSLNDGVVRAEYRNGDACHHIATVPRKAVITFLCDWREAFLEVMPENRCEYTFIVHTKYSCVKATPIGVECQVKGFHDLVAFQRLSKGMELEVGGEQVFLSVCDPLGPGVGDCPSGAAACLHDSSGKYINLGIPSPHYPPKPLEENKGVILRYMAGDICKDDTRWRTTLLLVCNKNVPVGVPQLVSKENCMYTLRWESISACPTELPVSQTTASICNIQDPYSSEPNLNFKPFLRNLNLITPDNRGGRYAIQLCGSGSPGDPPPNCHKSDTGICWLRENGINTTVVHAEHFFTIVSYLPRVIDVMFRSGIRCETNQERNWSAIVHMVCSDNEETMVPKLVSDKDCELHFDWRNQSFCAGESASRGCTARDDTSGYVYSLDALLSQNWTGLVSPSSSGLSEVGGSFSLGICRNLNPFSFYGLKCSSPSAVCWHTPDNRHINLGRSSSKADVVWNGGYKSIHIRYSHGDVCNSSSKEQYHTDLYVHCANQSTEHTSTPIMSLHDDGSGGGNCSWIISMNSALACQYNLISNSCHLETSSGIYDFSDLARRPLNFSAGNHSYSLCICGVSTSCKLFNVTGKKKVSLGGFRSLSVSTSSWGPMLSYYKGDICTSGGNTRFQSWLMMECSRQATDRNQNTLIELDSQSDAPSCTKMFLWYTPLACRSEEVTCSITTADSQVFYDFSLLHSQDRPWRVTSGDDIYYINICGAITYLSEYGIDACGSDVAVCKKSRDGSLTAIALSNTQQIIHENQDVSITFTGAFSEECRERRRFFVSIMMTCGLHNLKLASVSKCAYKFTWRNPHACKENFGPAVYQSCEQVPTAPQSEGFMFYPSAIPQRTWSDTTRGTFSINLCGPSTKCNSAGVSVCVLDKSPQTDIAVYTKTSIVVDGDMMLVQMSGKSGSTHAIIRVICHLQTDDVQVHEAKSDLMLDNIVQNSSHVYYYFSLYAKQGQGCLFISPTTASTIVPTAKDPSKSSHTVVVVTILVALFASSVLILIAIFYKKKHRDKVIKAFVDLTVGKSDVAVSYHKISQEEGEHSLMEDYSNSGSGSDDIALQPLGEDQLRGTNSDDDEELINLNL